MSDVVTEYRHGCSVRRTVQLKCLENQNSRCGIGEITRYDASERAVKLTK